MSEQTTKINWLAFILEDNGMSMGRLMAWGMFAILVYMWLAPVAVPETLITAFYVLLSYNFGKKLVPIASLLQTAMGKSGGITEREKALRLRQATEESLSEIQGEKDVKE